jgi:MFS transporter, PPP family, 3-phenylpropionic acid transporter
MSGAVPAARDRLYVRLCVLYWAVYLHYGVTTPFMPVWFEEQSYSPEQIALLMALPLWIKLVFLAPVMGFADRVRRIRDLAIGFVAAGAALLPAFNLAHGIWFAIAVMVAFALAWNPIPTLVDAYAIAAVQGRGLDFGRIRIWGSLAFIATNIAGGLLVEAFGPEHIMWLGAAFLAMPLLSLRMLPQDRTFPGARAAERNEWRELLRDRPLMLVLLGTALIGGSHALLNNFSSIHWRARGMSESAVGQLWAVGVVAEIIVLWFGKTWLGQRSAVVLIAIGGVGAMLRWLLLLLDPGFAALVPIQMLHAFSGIAPFLGMMLYVQSHVPPHLAASVQGLAALVAGVVMAIASTASGFVWRAFGVQGFWAMVLIAAVGLLIVWLATLPASVRSTADTSLEQR